MYIFAHVHVWMCLCIQTPIYRSSAEQFAYVYFCSCGLCILANVKIGLTMDLPMYIFAHVQICHVKIWPSRIAWICHSEPAKLHSRNPSYQMDRRRFFQTRFKHPSAHNDITKLSYMMRRDVI